MELPKTNDLSATWAYVEPGLKLIIGSDDNSSVTPQMYMNVYSVIYNYCVNKSRTPSNVANVTSSNQSSLLVGAEIYKKLKDYLKSYVQALEKQNNETFLQFYVKRWTRFTVGAGYLNHVFDYMNRYWVLKERSDGRRDVFDVNTLALLTWKDEMFLPHVEELIEEILEQIKLQRNNQIVDQTVLSTAIKSFVLLGIDVQDLKKPNLDIYINNFEIPFLNSTRQYYAQESNEYLSNHSIVEYMRKAEQRINEEESRETLFLDEHSKKPLCDTLNDVLIVSHSKEFYEEFSNLLDQNQIESIFKMFSLLNRVSSTLEPLATTFSNYVENKGLKIIDNLAISSAQDKKGVDPKLYIKSLIQVYQTYQEIVSLAFQNHPTFVKALDTACKNYININSIAKPKGYKGTSRTPDLLAKYSDTLLRKNKDSDVTSDMNVDDIMTVFKFITDKDAFETHYRRLLARRLIHGTSSSEEAEESIIQRLQAENSLEYTSKMTKMFLDVKASNELKILFKEEISKNKDTSSSEVIIPDFQPFILAETMWPFTYTKNNFQLPADLIPTYSKLEEIYSKKHSGRMLKWLWSLGRGDIKANLNKPGKPPFTLSMSLYQMAIILPFNENDTYSLGELIELTGLDLNTVSGSIAPMVKYKLLNQSPASPEAIKDPNTKFTVVSEYKSKRLKINFVSSVKLDSSNKEAEEAEKEINDDRKMYLQACIVRIMKARKTLSHSALINEVIQQSHQRFNAKVADIKKCIDTLIDGDYLQRADNQSYEYLA